MATWSHAELATIAVSVFDATNEKYEWPLAASRNDASANLCHWFCCVWFEVVKSLVVVSTEKQTNFDQKLKKHTQNSASAQGTPLSEELEAEENDPTVMVSLLVLLGPFDVVFIGIVMVFGPAALL